MIIGGSGVSEAKGVLAAEHGPPARPSHPLRAPRPPDPQSKGHRARWQGAGTACQGPKTVLGRASASPFDTLASAPPHPPLAFFSTHHPPLVVERRAIAGGGATTRALVVVAGSKRERAARGLGRVGERRHR